MDRLSHLIFVFSVANNDLGPEGAKFLAEALNVNTSMNKLNVLSNSIGAEGGQALVDAAPPQLQTFCGFEEGQAEADLSGQGLRPGDAILLAWELTTGYVSSSMKKLIIFRNNLGDKGIGIITSAVEGKEISMCGAEPGQTDLDLSNQGLGPADAKIIAWELTTGFVSSSMNSLK